MGAESLLTEDDESIDALKEKIHELQKQLHIQNDFFDTIPYLIAIVNLKGIILYSNQAMAKSLGKNKDELIGLNILDFFPEQTGEYRFTKALEAKKVKKPVEFIDMRNNHFFKSTYFPIIGENKAVTKIVAVVQDITKEKMKEKEQLKNKEVYFESLIENSLDLITVVDRNGTILYESPSLKHILGYTPEERRNKSIFDHIHPKDKKRVETYFSRIISKPGLTKKISFRITDKSGNWHYFESLGNNQLTNSRIQGLIINSRDISQRVKQQIEKNAILDNTSEIIAYHDTNHRIIWANKAYQKETGKNLDELIGTKCFHAWGLPNTCERCPLSRALKTGKTVETIFSPENQKNWPSDFKTWRIIGDPVFDEDGTIIGAIEISYDITQKKKAEEEIKRTKDHLEKLIHSTSEIIFSIDNQYKITLWNKTAENLSGIKAKRVIGKDIRKQNFIENIQELTTFIDKHLHHKPTSFTKLLLKTLFGSIRVLKVSTSFVTDEDNNITDIIFICNDITAKEEVHGTLINGRSYLVDGTTSDRLLTIFNDLISERRKGLFITRSQYEQFVQQMNLDHVTLAVLSDKNLEFAPTIPDLNKLNSFIQSFVQKHKHCILSLNRSDYLFTTFGFKQTLNTLYTINDVIRKNQAIFLIRINTQLLTDQQNEILREEFSSLPESQIENVYLNEPLFSLLSFIYEQNQTNTIVYQKSLTHQFSISKVTAQKRLDELKQKDLIFYKKQGRINQIFITDKGKKLLRRKQLD